MVFYTDTNGEMPAFSSRALVMLGMVMETTPLGEIDFEGFRQVTETLDDKDRGGAA